MAPCSNQNVSVYSGIDPTPSKAVPWYQVIKNIKSGRYKDAIKSVRSIRKTQNSNAYREAKKKLPAVTFGGTFNGNRNRNSVQDPTGLIVPDLDHIPDVEKTFADLITDEHIFFAFISPGGDGIKCGLRSEIVACDADHKQFYSTVENYFKEVYNIQIDPACKDISRLTFMSHDPNAYLNINAEYFDHSELDISQPEPKVYTTDTNPAKQKYGQKVLDSACNKIRASQPGYQHHTRVEQATLVGGFIPTGYIDRDHALSELENAVSDSGAQDMRSSMKDIADGIAYGEAKPLDPIAQNSGRSSKKNYKWTDLGNAERLVDMHGHDLRYCYPFSRWYVWDGRRWADDKTGEQKRKCKNVIRHMYTEARNYEDEKDRKEFIKFVMRCENRQKIEAMLAMAQSEPSIPVLPEELDTNPWLFNCKNGTIDLKTGELRYHSRGDMITKLAPFDYNPDAKCPFWLNHLHKVMDRDEQLVNFLQRAFGYSLTGDTSERVIFIQWGAGANGKSITDDCIAMALGDYAMRTPTETLLIKRNEGIPNDVARLMGARFVYAAEAEQGKKLAESSIKDMSGGEKIAARFMRAEWFEFYPEFKIWLGTNHKPIIKGTDNAIWDRIRLIPYNVRIDESDRLPKSVMLEKFESEMSGILAWLVKGCLEWQKVGLKPPSKVLAATQKYRTEMDIAGNFIEECCEVGEALTVTAKKLYEVYEQWSKDNGDKPMSKKMFGMKLHEQGYDSFAASRRVTTYIGLAPIEDLKV